MPSIENHAPTGTQVEDRVICCKGIWHSEEVNKSRQYSKKLMRLTRKGETTSVRLDCPADQTCITTEEI